MAFVCITVLSVNQDEIDAGRQRLLSESFSQQSVITTLMLLHPDLAVSKDCMKLIECILLDSYSYFGIIAVGRLP